MSTIKFSSLNLSEKLLRALDKEGYRRVANEQILGREPVHLATDDRVELRQLVLLGRP